MKKHNQTWDVRRKLGLLLIAIGLFILIAFPDSERPHMTKPLYLSGYSEEIASEPSKRSEVLFSLTLHNPGDEPYTIDRIVPNVSEQVASLVLVEPQLITNQDRLEGGEELTLYSGFTIDTSMLTEEQLRSIHPIIVGYFVDYNGNRQILLHIEP